MIKDFEYLGPKTVAETLKLLAKYKDAKIIAGGQSLLVVLKQGLVNPEYLVDIKGVTELDYIKSGEGNSLLIGALTIHRAIEKSPLVRKRCAVLCEMERHLATTQTRNWGTIGGNLCHADPAGDPAPVLIALNARIKLAGQRKERIIKLEDFFKGYLEVALRHGEILTEIEVPATAPRTGVAHEKLMVMHGDMGTVGAAVSITLGRTGGLCQDARIVISNAGPVPIRAKEAERVLVGKAITESLLAEAGEVASTEVDPPADVHGSTEYRREMVKVFVKRVARKALERAGA